MDNDEIVKILFAELVEELGGIVKLDAKKITHDIKNAKTKGIGISVENDIVTVEVFDEDEN